jgi:hypothetical protein
MGDKGVAQRTQRAEHRGHRGLNRKGERDDPRQTRNGLGSAGRNGPGEGRAEMWTGMYAVLAWLIG